MKKLIAFVSCALLAVSSQALSLQQGVQELVVEGNLDPSTAADSHIDLSVAYGYFVQDGLELGGRAFWADDDLLTAYGAGGFGEYNFDQGTELVPFAGAELSLQNAEVRDEDNSALVLSLYGGVKYFIAENVAISARGVFSAATDDVFPDDKKAESTDVRLELGMRFFFGP